jgi:N-acetylmuramoyl-L-alanine amidase
MRLLVVFLLLLLGIAGQHAARAQTVEQAINAAGCSTAVIAGLSKQLVRQLNCLHGGLFKDLNSLSRVRLSEAAQAVPFLQTAAANALQKAVNQRGQTMTINSALRTLPQQLMLYKWWQQGRCGITAAAPPGQSNHNGGLAVDIGDPYAWVSAMSAHGWHKLGDFDPPHYDYIGPGGLNIKSLSVLSFQKLWNLNNAHKLSEDGVYGPATEAAMLKSPVHGFARTC